MQCLDKYRDNVVAETNRNLRIILRVPDQEAIHEFRVGVKRLTALYRFLGKLDPSLHDRLVLGNYRQLFDSLGEIRESQIALEMIAELDTVSPAGKRPLVRALDDRVKRDYRSFRKFAESRDRLTTPLPRVGSSSLTAASIARNKQGFLDRSLVKLTRDEGRMNAEKWHRKRILLKRYRHLNDAFVHCPGQHLTDDALKQIKFLELLLGDWHDQVTTVAHLRSLTRLASRAEPLIKVLNQQKTSLLGSAKIYLNRFSRTYRHQG